MKDRTSYAGGMRLSRGRNDMKLSPMLL